jgi:hypothetical protein
MKESLKEKVIQHYFNSLKLGYSFRDSPRDRLTYVQVGRVMSHFFWMIIGLKQVNDPRISFDMTYYIQRRA